MKRRVYQTIMVLSGLLLTVGPATSAGPPNPTPSDASGNTAGGTNALINNVPGHLGPGSNNTAFGFRALTSNTIGAFNTAFGFRALTSNTMGALNTATGVEALFSNTTGYYNTASGFRALVRNTTGHRNTATGAEALYFNTTGNFNTASGVSALFFNTTGHDNTASGAFALFSNTTGHSNTATGAEALYANTTGLRNTAVGYQTLLANTTGTNNTALGWGAGAMLTTGSNNIYVGHAGVASESATLRLGNVQSRAFIKGVVNTPLSGNTVVINSAGQLGVVLSSERYKQDIAALAAPESAKVYELRPVTFHYKTEATGPLQYGLIAEEVAKIYPELVTRDEAGAIEGVRYEALTPLLLREVQGQHQQLTTQSQQLAELKAENQNLRVTQSQQLTELKAQNARLEAALVQQNAALAARLEQLEQGARGMTTVSTR